MAPPKAKLENGLTASDFETSKPAFVPERREIWYSDGTSGMYVLRLDKSVWPAVWERARVGEPMFLESFG